jgi:hypothetical protein
MTLKETLSITTLNAECCYAEYSIAFIVMLTVVKWYAVILRGFAPYHLPLSPNSIKLHTAVIFE